MKICMFTYWIIGATLLCTQSVSPKFSNSEGGLTLIDLTSGIHPSETYVQCHFNAMCYCKYDQKTEIQDALSRLWLLLRFNVSAFDEAVHQLVRSLASDPNSIYFVTPADIVGFSYVVSNSTTASRLQLFEPGPVFDIECSGVPIALVPTDYSTHGLISHISISGSSLGMLDGSAFAGLEVEGIRLSSNKLYFVSEFAFSSMGSSLRMLDLSTNFLDEIPLAAFKTLKSLEWLNLSNNLLNTVSGDWSSLTDSIRKLLLASNTIDVLPHKLFSAFTRLSSLDLSHNFLRNVTVEQLPINLQTLNLAKNRLTDFPMSVFHLKSLTWLYLSGCAIETIPQDWTAGLSPVQINQLDMAENFIQVWPSRAFGGQLTVLDLSLSKNYIEKLPAAAFDSMNVFRLSLGHNRLTNIHLNAFYSLEPTLKYLNLENNLLNSVPWPALANLSSLMHLYMGSNQLQDDGVELSNGGECKLTNLGLNGNQLTRLPRRLLADCPHLIHLNLGYNQIGHLDDLVHFRGGRKLKNLNTLILRNNPIRSLSYTGSSDSANSVDRDESWVTADQGESVTIPKSNSDNEISTLSVDVEKVLSLSSIPNVFRPEVLPNLRELSLSFCQVGGELEPFPALPITTLEISMGLRSATTLSPNIFQALRRLEWLALDHNTLQTLSEYTFYANRKLSYVNLEWNRLGNLPVQMFHPDIHPGLLNLRLAHNRISIIQTDAFLAFPALTIDLSHNLIHTIERNGFADTSGLKPAFQSTANKTSVNVSPTLGYTNPLLASVRESGPAGILTERPGLNLFLSFNRIGTLRPGAFSQVKFALIDLSFNKLSSFSFEVFGPATVVGGLNLSHNALTRVSGGIERQLVKVLDLSHNKIHSKYLDLSRLCITEQLDLSFNRLDQIDGHLFPLNCSFKELNLAENSITSLDPGTFTNLRDLTVLRLNQNLLTRLPTIMFIRNTKLKHLDLSRNKLRTIPRDGLVGSSLETLNLNSNQFVNLPIGALSQVSRRLRRLDISSNWLEHLDSTMFESVPGLVHLNLSSNRLSTLPDSAFANLASLRSLDLSRNPLRANFKELFHFLPKLKVLGLSGCGIKMLPFLPLPHLVSLDLSANGLYEIKMQSLNSLRRLRILDLSKNELTSQRLPSWTSLYSLTTLKMNKNPLKSLTRDTLHGLGRLETLELVDMGRLDRFDSDVFSHLHNLRSLAVETYPNIEKYRFRLGAVLSSIPHLEELYMKIKEPTLSDQLLGGLLPKLRKVTITGRELRKIEAGALEGLQNSFHVELSITHTSIEDLPSRVFHILQTNAWARLDLSFNKMTSLHSAALYPNKTVWFSKGTKILEGGLILDGNEFVCDCDLVWIGEWLRRWLRESFQSHSTENRGQVEDMYQALRRPGCTDSKGRLVPLIELYSDVMCHASALSQAPILTLRISSMLLLLLGNIMGLYLLTNPS